MYMYIPCSVCEREKEGDLDPRFPDDGTFIQLPWVKKKKIKAYFLILYTITFIAYYTCIVYTCAVLCSAVKASCQKLVVRGTEVEASSAEAGNTKINSLQL